MTTVKLEDQVYTCGICGSSTANQQEICTRCNRKYNRDWSRKDNINAFTPTEHWQPGLLLSSYRVSWKLA